MRYKCVLLWCMFALSVQRSTGMDCASEYIYDRQPPSVIVCNPYINQAALLDCAVTGPGPAQLHWYFSPTLDPLIPVVIINSSRYELQDMTDSNTTTRVALAVRSLSAPTENVTAGYYWCQGTVPGGELTPSGKVKLERTDYYKYVTTPCFSKTYLRSSDRGCPIVLSQTGTSTLSTAPEPSQVMTTIPTVTQSTVWPERLPTPWQATSSAPGVDNDSKESASPAKSTASTDTGQGMLDPVQSSNTWLYIILGVSAISLLVIVVLGVVIFKMCRRHVRKEDSELNADKEKLSEPSVATGALGVKTGSVPAPPPPPHRHIPYYQQTTDVHLPHVLSEDYAEVGPARMDQRLQVSHDYSEIREFLPEASLHLTTSALHSGQHQVPLSSAQLLPTTALQSRDCHTSEDAPAPLPTSAFMTPNLSAQFCDIISANENEGDAMGDHTYHILQLSGYSSSDNTSEVNAVGNVGSAVAEGGGITVTVPIMDLGDCDTASTPSETCVSTGLVGLVEMAIASVPDATVEEGYSQLAKLPASVSVPSGDILLAAQDDDGYSHLVRAVEVVPSGNCGRPESNPAVGIQNVTTIVVGSERNMGDHIATTNPTIACLDALMFPTDGLHPVPGNPPLSLVLPSNSTDRDVREVIAPVDVTTAENDVPATSQGVAATSLGTAAEEASQPVLSKYNGDYERDSAYMGVLQWVSGRQSNTYVNQTFLNDAHHITPMMPHVQDDVMCQSMESLYPEAHLYQALMARTKEKSKQYMDLRLDGDQLRPCIDLLRDGDQTRPCMDLLVGGDQPCMCSQLDGDQCTNSQHDGDQLKMYMDLQLSGDQSRQYTDLQLDSHH